MTALEFIALGGAFAWVDTRLVIRGPAGREDILRRLRFEVRTRVKLVGAGQRFAVVEPRDWCCDVCGDVIGCAKPGSGSCPLCAVPGATCRRVCYGTCELCIYARRTAIAEANGVAA